MRSRVHRSSAILRSADRRLTAHSASKFFSLTFFIGSSNFEGSSIQASMNSLCLALPPRGTDKRLSWTAPFAALPMWMLKRALLVLSRKGLQEPSI